VSKNFVKLIAQMEADFAKGEAVITQEVQKEKQED
jgi:hypothetical protein